MQDKHHYAILKQGVNVWNRWRMEHPDVERPGLAGVFFAGAILTEVKSTGVDLAGANLLAADFTGAILRHANFNAADLRGINLVEADLREAVFHEANLTGTNLANANLTGSILTRAILSGTNLTKANLTSAFLNQSMMIRADVSEAIMVDCGVFGIAAWELRGTPKEQKRLNISDRGEPVVLVDDLELAQFVYSLIHRNKLRNVLTAFVERGVLILGRFRGGGIDVLHAVADVLRENGYLPMIFEFDRPPGRSYTETIQVLAGLSRFVIVDLSGPSVPQELSATVPHYPNVPFVPILEADRDPYSLFDDLLDYPNMLRPIVKFVDIDQLRSLVRSHVITPAERCVVAQQELRRQPHAR